MTLRDDIKVLFDADLDNRLDMRELIRICAAAVDADAAGRLVAPPRHRVDFNTGGLVFTTGGLDKTVGFRAYDTFPESHQDQVVAVWDRSTGRMQGVVIGHRLGALRTGAIGGVAVDRLSDPAATICAVIGAGLQARTQLLACAAVRSLTTVRVHSPTPASREAFAAEMTAALGIDVHPVREAAAALADAEIVLIATTSRTPVVDHTDLRSEVHINTVGPKFRDAHEIDVALAETARRLVSDAPQQIAAQGTNHVLAGSEAADRIEHLGNVTPTTHQPGQTLFLSAGLAGTEVLVADAFLRS